MSSLPYYLFTGESHSSSKEASAASSVSIQANNRQKFLDQLRANRLSSQDEKRRSVNIGKIQAAWRSYASRKKLKRQMRTEFDAISNDLESLSNSAINRLNHQIKLINYFMDVNIEDDMKRMALLITSVQTSGYLCCDNAKDNRYTVGSFLVCCVKYVQRIAAGTGSLTVLRCFEVFFDSIALDCATVKRLLKNGYFLMLAQLTRSRVPNDILVNLNENIKAPTILAESIFNLHRLPLDFALKTDSLHFRSFVFGKFLADFTADFSPVALHYFLPSLSKLYPLNNFLLPLDFSDEDAIGVGHMTDVLPFAYVVVYLINHCQRSNIISLDKIIGLLHKAFSGLYEQLKSRLDIDVTLSHDEDDEDSMEICRNELPALIKPFLSMCNDISLRTCLASAVDQSSVKKNDYLLEQIVFICYVLFRLQRHFFNDQSNELLMALTVKRDFLPQLWTLILTRRIRVSDGVASFLNELKSGRSIKEAERKHCLPLLHVFCELFASYLRTADDSEVTSMIQPAFITTSEKTLFNIGQMIDISAILRDVTIGLIKLALPDNRPLLSERFKAALIEMGADLSPPCPAEWNRLFESTVSLLQLMRQCDERLKFCPPGHWAVRNCAALQNKSLFRRSNRVQHDRLFNLAQYFSKKSTEQEKQGLSLEDLRTMTVLRKVPFLIPFEERVTFLYQLTLQDKISNGRSMVWSPGIPITVSRNRIYEDSLDELSPQNITNLKQVLRISMRNWAGATEAGVDGGGIFREFISELLKAGFSPERGLFTSTHDNQLYPNPLSRLIYPDFRRHFHFLGRVLGKLIFENQLAELPLAQFFLSRLLTYESHNVEIRHLESFDPVLYKNLLWIKSRSADVSDLQLDFSLTVDEFGEIKTVDLKPNGREIRVTNENKLEYVQLVTNFYLDTQIRDQIIAFCNGLSELIDLDWLQMFDPRELQMIISGDDRMLDINDLRNHTKYAGESSDDVVGMFWRVIGEFSDESKRKLLKFVTGCSRPPLLGFKDLLPPFCIQFVPADQDRLPTAATCMNLLKMPKFTDFELMKQKLQYAIESASGFELS